MNLSNFIESIEKLNIILSDKQLEQLEIYYELLIEKNKVMNLTGITSKDEVFLKHFYDSLTIVKIIDLNKIVSLCDIGTGAGFPGLVLKIVYPNLEVSLVDSLNKRILFLKEVVEKLNLKNINIIHARAEEFSKENQEKFDLVTARAVAHLSNLLEYSSQTIKINGYFVAMKGNVEVELEESSNAIKLLNMKLDNKIEFILPIENSKRTLISFRKIKKTPSKYPRRYNEIKNNRI